MKPPNERAAPSPKKAAHNQNTPQATESNGRLQQEIERGGTVESPALAAQEDADKARKRSVKLLRGMLGNGGLQAFLKSPQPAYDDLTGDQILTRDPHGLLAKLEALERGAE